LSGNPNVELVAMADIFEDNLEGSLGRLRDPEYVSKSVAQVAEFTGKSQADLVKSVSERVKVEPTARFSSFDAFKKLSHRTWISLYYARRPGTVRNTSRRP
jgi:hypothetical protein